ncbi:Papain-like cysteine peptidase superfamily [Sesbania bispinosa]|nr:Papain-like cysteine peptidase superfamily [Sesbania bispinosa]
MKMQMQSTQTPLQRTTGNSFLKTENDMFYNRDSGIDLKVIASNFRRGHNLSAPNHTQESQVEDKSTLIMPRKLSFSPPGAFKKQKVSNLEPGKKCTPRRTPANKNVITVAQQNKNVAKTYIKTKFKPFVDMKLTPAEVHLSLYIFQVKGDPSKNWNIICHKGYIGVFMSDESVNREIIRLLARKISYDQRHLPSPETTWCLPPSFVWDIYRGSDVDKLLDVYTEEWMPPSRNLKYIYVPFEEMNDQWFLMVLCLHEELLYHFDSCGLPQTMSDKHQSIKKVGAHNQTLNEVLGKAEAFWQHIKNSNQQ